ncbi:DUF2125 domain-containing protein [Parvularcula lutaonensis]|uniref:DUF2125 domain-containing protein n=1 Tax=Parvularcula lutaonensis TaxID=491923 RepID=A0ABV7MA45_9PROT|nr:DUF2125 domain-containing protein [Parvularcula lutaonensis]GGY45103.1 hypothetical protein GCM10007148_12590 [Parvularcula lutaonensis]
MTENRAPRRIIVGAFAIFAVLAVLYTIMWNTGARKMKEEIAAFAAREAEAGRSFTYDRIDVAGYPFTLRGKVRNLIWASDLYRFDAEDVTIATLPYDPSRIIFAPRGKRTLRIGDEAYDLQSDDLRFSLEPNFVVMEGHGLILTGKDRAMAIGDVIANSRRLGGGSAIAVQIKNWSFGGEADARMTYFNLAASRENGVLTIAGMSAGIGEGEDTSPTQIQGQGTLSANEEGVLDGRLDLKLKNERPLLTLLGRTAAFDPSTMDTAASLLGAVTNQGTREIELPLVIDGGDLKLGPVSLGELPPVSL